MKTCQIGNQSSAGQQADVERQIESLPQTDGTQGKAVLGAFDLSQNLAQIWRGSNSALRRELLDCVSLNRTLSDVSLCLEKRKPFDVFAERPFLKNSRGDCRSFEPSGPAWDETLAPLLERPEPHVLRAAELAASLL